LQADLAEDDLHAAEGVSPSPAMRMLAERLGLSRFEQEILLLCAAMEFDTRIPSLCARAQGDHTRPYPTFALAMALFDSPTWDALTPSRPLRYWQLLEINQAAGVPLMAAALRADERIVSYLKGLNYLDDRLVPLLTLLDGMEKDDELPPSQRAVLDQALLALQQADLTQALPVIQLPGSDPLSKELVARHAAQALGLRVYRLDAGMFPAQLGEAENFTRLWGRESLLLPVALYIDAHNLADAGSHEGQLQALQRFIAHSSGLIFLASREPWSGSTRESILLDVQRPTPGEQKSAWGEVFAGETSTNGRTPALLAGHFNLNLPTIHSLARATLSSNQQDIHSQVWRASLARTRPRMEMLAQRIDARATWQDIVLTETEERTLHQIADQVAQRSRVYDEWGFRQKMNRGLGISALFAGESGTGKTMAAEVIANDLQLDLYRIDLSSVVSKYIGETEKNLRKLFDAAEDGGAILFFDEADALFGKRSEVKDSHDRYANIEINYLLQRMEAYRGLAILATNMKNALDQAFMRRLRFVVNFPFPGLTERRLIWERIFPPETPVDDLDHARLARFHLTGGSIHNAALNAAFLAAQANTAVTMPLLFEAIKAEFLKLDKPVFEADYR
jgi:ATP-dependent 26S proteasome regulatory subunit